MGLANLALRLGQTGRCVRVGGYSAATCACLAIAAALNAAMLTRCPATRPLPYRHHILHLRAVNQHVNSVFDGHARQPACRGWLARRQPAPMLCSGDQVLGSVSSFAYQGTNSHAVLATTWPVPLAAPKPWVWQRRRLWYQATSHPLLQRANVGLAGGTPTEARMQCSLRRASLGYLWDHQVGPNVNGCSVLSA